MSINPSSTHSKTESHIIHSSSQYTRSKIRSNNSKINPTIEIKSPYPRAVPSSGDGYPKKKVYEKYSYRQVNTEVNPTSPRVTLGIKKEYKRHTEKKEYEYMNKIPLKEQNNRSINQNHSYYVSKNNNNSDENKTKKYQQRSSYTLKQPEDKRLTEKYQIYEVAKNNNNYNYNNRYENSNLYPRKSNDSNTSNYLIKSRDSKQNIKDENQGRRQYTNKSYQGEKFPPKYYRNNPLLRTENINEENNASNNKKSYLLKNNKNNIFIGNMETVAQKICNIVIKGSNPNKEKESKFIPKKSKY